MQIITEKIIEENIKVSLEQINHDTYIYKMIDMDVNKIVGIRKSKNLDILKAYYDKTIWYRRNIK